MESQIIVCPECGSDYLYKDGLRYLQDGTVQRWLCCSCGYRFSETNKKVNVTGKVSETFDSGQNRHEVGVTPHDCSFKKIADGSSLVFSENVSSHLSSDLSIVEKRLNSLPFYNSNRQLCVIPQEAKKLDPTIETKTIVGDLERLPQDARGLITKYMAYLEREGYYKETSYFDLISSIASDGANLLDPEDVKAKIAKHKYNDKRGKEHPWKDSVKMLSCYAYDLFCKMEGITWTKPKYKQQETILDIPDEKDLDALILSSQSRRMIAFLQSLKETYADPGEVLAINWKEIKGNVIAIAHPCKGHLTGEYEVSARLISMLNALPRTDERVFPTKYRNMYHCLDKLKKKVARKLQNPRLLSITFKSFRHWGGSTIAHYTNGNVLTVKKMLRHKSIANTMKYIHTLQFKDEDFEETAATTPEEVRQLGKSGWTKYDEMTINGTQIHFYRKPKRFGGLQ